MVGLVKREKVNKGELIFNQYSTPEYARLRKFYDISLKIFSVLLPISVITFFFIITNEITAFFFLISLMCFFGFLAGKYWTPPTSIRIYSNGVETQLTKPYKHKEWFGELGGSIDKVRFVPFETIEAVRCVSISKRHPLNLGFLVRVDVKLSDRKLCFVVPFQETYRVTRILKNQLGNKWKNVYTPKSGQLDPLADL